MEYEVHIRFCVQTKYGQAKKDMDEVFLSKKLPFVPYRGLKINVEGPLLEGHAVSFNFSIQLRRVRWCDMGDRSFFEVRAMKVFTTSSDDLRAAFEEVGWNVG